MTGFGRVSNRTKAASQPEIDVSVRAVNGRYLEMRFHLPREYAGLESDFKSLLTKIFSRGTVDVYVNRTARLSHAKVEVNTELAKELMRAHSALARATNLSGDASLDWLTRAPDVLTVVQSDQLTDDEAYEAKALVEAAAVACDSERLREGQALAQELEKQCAALETIAAQVEVLKSEANAELEKRYRERLASGLQKFGLAGQVDEQRMAQEIVIQLDRADISEEIQRLTEHIKAYRALLKHTEPQGKKLDFYAQELLREVNTIGSKSHIAKLTSLVVEAKTIVERIREQVQNCE